MSARKAGAQRSQILVFGEHEHDRDCVVNVIRGLRPDLQSMKIVKARKPLTLVRGMSPAGARSRNSGVLAAIRAADVRAPVRATLLHEDADALEPAHEALIDAKESALRAAPGKIFAVVPAWTMETWLMLFPDAIALYRPSWPVLTKYIGRNVGLIRDSKKELTRSLRRQGAQDYVEGDSPKIFAVASQNSTLSEPKAYSASWNQFVEKVATI